MPYIFMPLTPYISTGNDKATAASKNHDVGVMLRVHWGQISPQRKLVCGHSLLDSM